MPTLIYSCTKNPISWELSRFGGYVMSKPVSEKITHSLYVDDLKTYDKSRNNQKKKMSHAMNIMIDAGLEWNIKKSKVLSITNGIVNLTEGDLTLIDGTKLKCLENEELYKFLGIPENELHNVDKIVESIYDLLRKQSLNTAYWCFSSQISIVLCSLFASSDSVADVAAIGRVGMILMVLTTVISDIVVPRFARVEEGIKLKKILSLTVLFFCLITAPILFISYSMPELFTFILGEKYENASHIIYLFFLSCVLASLSGVFSNFSAAKGWIVHPKTIIPISILGQLIGIMFFAFHAVSAQLGLRSYGGAYGISLGDQSVALSGVQAAWINPSAVVQAPISVGLVAENRFIDTEIRQIGVTGILPLNDNSGVGLTIRQVSISSFR